MTPRQLKIRCAFNPDEDKLVIEGPDDEGDLTVCLDMPNQPEDLCVCLDKKGAEQVRDFLNEYLGAKKPD